MNTLKEFDSFLSEYAIHPSYVFIHPRKAELLVRLSKHKIRRSFDFKYSSKVRSKQA